MNRRGCTVMKMPAAILVKLREAQTERKANSDLNSTPCMNGRATTQDVFKPYVFFFCVSLFLQLQTSINPV